MNSSSLALICGIGFFLQKKSNKWRIPSRRELELSRTGLISQTLPNPSALWKCFPHPSALLRLSLRRQNPRPHHRQEIIPKESLSIDTMSRNLDWKLDLEYYSVCLLYSFFTQGLRKSHTISHSSYLKLAKANVFPVVASLRPTGKRLRSHAYLFVTYRLTFFYNPLSPNSDQHQFSPDNIHTRSRDEVLRINKIII